VITRGKHMSLYRNILGQAWKITWRNKYLWFFGLFAALLGNGGEYEILFRGLSGDSGKDFFPGWRNIAETGVFSSGTLANISQLFRSDTFSMIILLIIGLVILVLFGFLVWLTIVSQVALVNNSAGVIAGKTRHFKDGVISGMKNFWPVFGLNIIIKAIIYLAFALIGLPIIFSVFKGGWQIASVLYMVLFIILIPVAIAFSFMIKYAIAYVVIKGSGFLSAIREGWKLFTKNWLVSIEMAFILFLINFLVGLGIVLIILILAIPFLFLALILYKLMALIGFWLVALIGLATFLLIIMIGGAGLATFQVSSWTGLFIELIGKGGTSKITRVLDRIKGK